MPLVREMQCAHRGSCEAQSSLFQKCVSKVSAVVRFRFRARQSEPRELGLQPRSFFPGQVIHLSDASPGGKRPGSQARASTTSFVDAERHVSQGARLLSRSARLEPYLSCRRHEALCNGLSLDFACDKDWEALKQYGNNPASAVYLCDSNYHDDGASLEPKREVQLLDASQVAFQILVGGADRNTFLRRIDQVLHG